MSKTPSAPRVAALVGPYTAGKTSLLESLLFTTKAIPRKGSVKDGSTVGDPSPEAKARQMSVETSAACTSFLGESWTFLDCPGSVEFFQDAMNALMVVDAAVVVTEADPNRAIMASSVLKFLDDRQIPHVLFLNKVDLVTEVGKVRETLSALQQYSERPLVLRHLPIVEGGVINGFVDLISERAYKFNPGHEDTRIEIPADMKDDVAIARQETLEAICGLDDRLMEELLEEKVPSLDEIYAVLTKGFQEDQIVPVLLGSADKDGGVLRLMKILRHETAEPSTTANASTSPRRAPSPWPRSSRPSRPSTSASSPGSASGAARWPRATPSTACALPLSPRSSAASRTSWPRPRWARWPPWAAWSPSRPATCWWRTARRLSCRGWRPSSP